MSFGQQTPRAYIEDKHGELDRAVNNVLAGDVTVVSLVSINDDAGGQMILADTSYDKRKLAARLRLCADILDAGNSNSALTPSEITLLAYSEGHGFVVDAPNLVAAARLYELKLVEAEMDYVGLTIYLTNAGSNELKKGKKAATA